MPRKSRRPVYDPNLAPSLFDKDPLALEGGGQVFQEDQTDEDLVSSIIVRDPSLHKDEVQRKQVYWRYIYALLALGGVFLLVGISLRAKGSNNRGSHEQSSSVHNRPPNTEYGVNENGVKPTPPKDCEYDLPVLPTIPTDLVDWCSAETISSGNRLQCEDACEQALCCYYPVGSEFSCVKGNQAACVEYQQSCYILEDFTLADDDEPQQLPPPPPLETNLGAVCSIDKLNTIQGQAECQEACDVAACCFTGTCTGNTDNCYDYDLCWNLETMSKIDNQIKNSVDRLCENVPTVDEKLACQQVCQSALCCYADGISCPAANDEFCAQYEACASVMTVQVVEINPEDDDEVMEDDEELDDDQFNDDDIGEDDLFDDIVDDDIGEDDLFDDIVDDDIGEDDMLDDFVDDDIGEDDMFDDIVDDDQIREAQAKEKKAAIDAACGENDDMPCASACIKGVCCFAVDDKCAVASDGLDCDVYEACSRLY